VEAWAEWTSNRLRTKKARTRPGLLGKLTPHDIMMLSGRSCRVSSNYPNSKLGEFEIVREVHDIQGGNGADASFRFLTIN
jgi:hypothetical protein